MKKVLKFKRDARKKQTAEVFTPQILVREILNKLPKDVWEPGKTFCDPSAGNGNFLVEVLKYKVVLYKQDPIEALETIYGVELMKDNVIECRHRLFNLMKKLFSLCGKKRTQKDNKKIIEILKNNIVCADALTFNFWERKLI